MQNRKTVKEIETVEKHFKNLTVNFNSYSRIKKPGITDKSPFYKIQSPGKLKLRPRDDIHLDLKFNVEKLDRIKPWVNLLPSLKCLGLYIENEDCQSNLTKDDTIQLHLLNKSSIIQYRLKKNNVSNLFFYQDKNLAIRLLQNIIY